jgi:hypothetical protein
MRTCDSGLPNLVNRADSSSSYGNGRVGRLLITLFLIERQILPTPLLYIAIF